MPKLDAELGVLCPLTRRPLTERCLAPERLASGLSQLAANWARALGTVTPQITWLTAGDGPRYPVLDDTPLLLEDYAHDSRGPLGATAGVAHDELDFYNAVSFREAADLDESATWRTLAPAVNGVGAFPDDVERWIDAPYDGPAQLRCYAYLADLLPGGTLCQVGGTGSHAVKFLLAGASRAIVVSPIVGEMAVTVACARRAGVAGALGTVVASGEALPLPDHCVDGILCGGTLHHMNTFRAGCQFARVLRESGRVAAAEPWKVPVLHAAGTRALGKREAVGCRPIDHARLAAFAAGFRAADTEVTVTPRRHGALTRYPLLALGKAGVRPDKGKLLRWMLADDALAGRLQALGGSLSLLAQRGATATEASRRGEPLASSSRT